MKKVMICLIGCFLMALTTVRAQDSGRSGADSVISLGPDTSTQTPAQTPTPTPTQPSTHSTISHDTATTPSAVPDTSFRYHGDTSTAASSKHTDTLITLTDAPNPQSTVSHDTMTTKKTVGGNTIEIKTVGATINKDSTQNQNGQARNDVAKADPQQDAQDTATKDDRAEEYKHELDPRWFLGVKGQFQDFAFLEKNRKGYLSDANTLPFMKRGNTSVALSAYKNLTQRLSFSADLGLSFGHVTSNDVLISQTKSMTFNQLNASIYYHLLSAAYRLQPYVTVGFNDIINNGSYPTVPLGVGAKFNSRKVMVLGQVTYGQSISKSVASSTMYSVGIYIPLKSKKYKNLDTTDNSQLNRRKKDNARNDTTGKGGTVINNIYVTINMDSILKAKGLLDDNGNPFGNGNGNGNTARRGGRGGNGDDGDDGDDVVARAKKRKRPFAGLGLDDFNENDYKIDSLDGKPVIRFVVYFEFNEYGLNSSAFTGIDKVISHLKRSSDFSVVEIKGYTDSVGSDPYNNMLSRRRAKMVLDYMNSRGVPTEIMKAKAYGSDNPVADNSDPNKAWLNRRAEIIIHKKEELAAQ